MVGTMTKALFVTTVTRKDAGWLLATDVPEVGLIHAFADSDLEIDLMVRQNVCSFTDLQPFDFDIHFEFPGESPAKTIETV